MCPESWGRFLYYQTISLILQYMLSGRPLKEMNVFSKAFSEVFAEVFLETFLIVFLRLFIEVLPEVFTKSFTVISPSHSS